MNAQEAIETFRRKAVAGEVMNLRDGKVGAISATVQASIESSYRTAITHAAGKCDLTQITHDAFADHLAEHAVRHADEYGLTDGSNRAARCRRFVATVDGKVRNRSRLGTGAVPDAWRELHAILLHHEQGQGKRPRKAASLVALAQHVAVHGVREPAQLPNKNTLKDWLVKSGSVAPQAFTRMMAAYREARRLLCSGSPLDLPDIDRCPVEVERGLRALPDIVERLEAKGYGGPVRDVDVLEVIRLLAPRWHAVMSSYIAEHCTSRARDFSKKVIGASSRFLAELVRSGHGDLESAHPTPLLLQMVDTGRVVARDAIGGDEWEAEFASNLGIDLTTDAEQGSTLEIRLIELLAHEMAHESAERSPLTILKGNGDFGPPFWTQAVIGDTRIVGQLAMYAGKASRIFRVKPEIAREAEVSVTAFIRRMTQANARASFADRKAKSRLLHLVTLPMILCIGLPALRREVFRRRDAWHAAMIRHSSVPDHLRVVRAENAYDGWLTLYLVFATFIADGLRLANVSGARLGCVEERKLAEATAPDGTQVHSYCHVQPLVDAEGDGLHGVKTNFFGDDHELVKLKIDKVPGSDEWREHPHWLRPGIVDMELLWDYLTRVRPKRLASQDLIPDPTSHDLGQDIAEQHFALFVSGTRSTESYRAVTGAYTPQAISGMFGRALHWICTTALGRALPAWGSEVKRAFPMVFSAHSARLLLGTHLYGVLDRKTDAAVLLNDTVRMVERRYSVTEASMIHRTGWEHPRFFDSYFKRIWDDGEVIDWEREDPLAGVPAADRPGALPSAA
jgi:hypothetical protein